MIDFFKKIFCAKSLKGDENLPPRPDDWKLTMSDLMQEMNEGKRKQVGHPEIGWAREYENSLIPKNYRFPQKGDLYESKIDQTITFLTAWKAPFTGGGKSTLKKGDKIWIADKPTNDKPTRTYALPVDYKLLEERMVSFSDRNSPKYGGFYFSVSTIDLNEKFTLVQTDFSKEMYE